MLTEERPAMKKTYLAGVGNSNDPLTWSGTPFHLLEAGRRIGIIDEGLNLSACAPVWKLKRLLWNAATLAQGRHYGGFQYSNWFLERLYAPFQKVITNSRMLNWFQMYPASIIENNTIEKWFYIDMTLRQMFRCYGTSPDDHTAAIAIQQETAGYHASTGIMTLSQWAARSLVADYGVSPHRVHAVVPGANISSSIYSKWLTVTGYRPMDPEQPLRLVFSGRYWQRKGLDRLLDAFQLARSRGANLTIRVIGVLRESVPQQYRNIPAVEWLGIIDKGASPAALLNAVSECDVGCLLSRADASPIAIREFCALGLVTLCTDAGGSSEMTVPEASVSVSVNATNEEIAETLLRLCNDRQVTEQMRQHAWNHRHEALWSATVDGMRTFMPASSGQHSIN
jgi:glycosyltransferase involved in cell wall biosynthesis